MKKVVICEDHQLVREGLKKLITSFGGYDVIKALNNGESLISYILKNKPDLIILDVSLPGRSGLETLKNIISFYPDMNVLALSMYAEKHYALRMLKSGAKGYLNKDCSPEVLEHAINLVSKGTEYLSPSLTKILFSNMNKKSQDLPHHNLSDREYEVFLALGDGVSLSELGNKLNLSVKTISTYKSRVFEKMNVSNNSDLVKYIISHELDSTKNTLTNL